MSVPPKYPDSDSSRTLVKFHPVWVRCWVRFSLAASVHRPIWVGAAFNGPSRHCLHGLLNLDSPGYDGMKPVSSESVLEEKRRTRKQGFLGLPFVYSLAHVTHKHSKTHTQMHTETRVSMPQCTNSLLLLLLLLWLFLCPLITIGFIVLFMFIAIIVIVVIYWFVQIMFPTCCKQIE